MTLRRALVATALPLSLWASPAFGQALDGPHAGMRGGWARTDVRLAAAGGEIRPVSDDTRAGEPALATASEPLTMVTTDDLPDRQEEGACCNGVGGPIEDEPVVVVGHLADPAGERYRLAPADANLERRYAPGPAPSLNPITLRF